MAETSRRPILPGLFARRAMPGAVLAGALAGLGQAPVSLPWATMAGLAIAFALHRRTERIRGAAWLGWAFGAGHFAATLFWIVEPFFVDVARHGWMAPFALFLMAGGLALFWAAGAALARWLAPGAGWSAALAWTAGLGAAELARSYVMTGFPWALIGHVWVGWAPMQLAAWVGPIGLTLLTLLTVSLALTAWTARRALVLPVLAAGAALYAAGVWQAARPVPAPGGGVVRLVQPNAAQHLKWDPDHAQTFFARQIGYTAAATERRPDLVVWPETAVPTALHRAGPLLDNIAEAAAGVPVVLGIQRWDGESAFNSLVVLDGEGEVTQVYDKYHLVPFGEYLPYYETLQNLPFGTFIREHGFGYTPGAGAQLVDLGGLGQALPLICYEAIFPQDVAAAPARPDWLLQITNDAWFGQVSGPYQHLAQARLRAVEQGLPMLRVANTGVSAAIDARGRVTAALGLGQAGYLDVALPAALPATLYSRTGDLPAGLALVALALLAAFGRRRRTTFH